MDTNLTQVIDLRLAATAEALRKNRFNAFVIRSREELFDKLRELIPAGASCSVGGSVTLHETGVIDFLKNGGFQYLDRYAENADTHRVFHEALSCQVYLMSSQAVTEKGQLYNMDGNGNRVAALAYGPEKVVVIAGHNKIVPDIDAARARNRRIAAPANAQRLGKRDLPCYHTGQCADCNSPGRFCATEVITHCQLNPNRITVLLLGEDAGY